MRFGLITPPDPFRARADAENQMMEQAELLRCIDAFSTRDEFKQGYAKLEKIQKACRLPQGHLAIAVLRAYHEWSTQSQERALVAVYRYLQTIAPGAIPTPPKNEDDLVQAFRTGKAKRSRDLSAEVYADALLALGSFLTVWNKRNP
jgi:hypothetical protein